MRVLVAAALVLAGIAQAFGPAAAQQNPNAPQNFVKIAAPVVELTHARVMDGTGRPARADQPLVLRDGAIAALGDASTVAPPAGATIVDLTGRSVMPGLVMMHEHLYTYRSRATH